MKDRYSIRSRVDSATEDKAIFFLSLLICLATVKIGLM